MNARTTRWLHAVHKWTGLITGLNVLLLSVTGACLVFMQEVERGFPGPPGEVAGTVDVRGGAPLQAALDLLGPKNAEARPAVVYRSKLEHDVVVFGFSNGKRYGLDMTNGEVRAMEVAASTKLHSFIYQLHENLLLGTNGALFVGGIGVLFLISTITGLLLYGPFMKGAMVNVLRWDRGLRRGAADLHKLLGSVGLAFNLMIGLTGVVLIFGLLLERQWLLREAAVFAGAPSAAEAATLPKFDDVVQRTQVPPAEPGFFSITFPGALQGANHYLAFNQGPGPIGRYMSVIALVPVTPGPAKVLVMPLWVQVVFACIPFHFGNFGGLGMKVVYAILGLGSGALSVSGAVLSFSAWAKRWRMRRRRSVA